MLILSKYLLGLCLAWLLSLSAQAQDEIKIASPHWEGIQHEFERAFREHYKAKTSRTVEVRWIDLGGTSQIEKAVNALYAQDPSTCGMDVFFGGGIDPFMRQHAKGHLEPYKLPQPVLSKLPETALGQPIIGDDHAYYGAALSSFGILENLRVVAQVGLPAVKTWENLARPELFSWVSSADPRKSGSVHMIYEIILQAYGWERGWQVIYEFSGNVRSFLQSSSSPTKEVGVGDVAYAVSIDINGMTQQAFLGKENVRFIVPLGLSIINPDGIGIFKGAPNLAVAQEFVAFVMSERGQSLWMKPLGSPEGAQRYGITRMGVIPSMYNVDLKDLLVPLNPFEVKDPLAYDSGKGGKRWSVINDLIGQTIIDVHTHLKRAWVAINAMPEGPAKEALLQEFGTPPVSEAEAAEHAGWWRKDKVRAGDTRNEWMIDAVAKFKDLAQRATQK